MSKETVEKRVVRTKGEDFVSFTVGKVTHTIKVSEIHPAALNAVIVHGLNAKIGDGFAGAKDLTDSQIADGIASRIANLKAGVFNATGGGGTGTSILAEALARIKGLDVSVTAAAVAKLDDEQLKEVSSNLKVKEMILKIRAERASKVAKAEKDSASALDEMLKGLL